MKLWLLTRTDKVDYDEFDECVVVAKTEEEAKKIHPGGSSYENYKAWAAPRTLKAELVGTAAKHLRAGEVVCASFRAG